MKPNEGFSFQWLSYVQLSIKLQKNLSIKQRPSDSTWLNSVPRLGHGFSRQEYLLQRRMKQNETTNWPLPIQG